MKIILIYLILFLSVSAYAQFNDDANCSPGIHGPTWAEPYQNASRAVFRFNCPDGGRCTGTLINQKVSSNSVRQLFITAQHCIRRNGVLRNLNNVRFAFNFQSNNGDNNSIPDLTNPFPNRGERDDQFRYDFVSNVNLIYESGLYDFALVEILTPIPPHYNVYYAGWLTRDFLGPNSILDTPIAGIHHPSGDTKKISRTYSVAKNDNPVANGCRVITRAIDSIIRLFGGKSISELVCKYVDIPYYSVLYWNDGGIREGSSGSALFNRDSYVFGVLSWDFESNGACHNLLTQYGKFTSAYATRQVRHALNPDYDTWTNLIGIPGRQISCYPSTTLSGNYFPARDYQPQNRIFLSSSDRFTLAGNDPLTVFDGADFVITAANQISLQPGFTAQLGSTLSLAISPCSNGASRIASNEPVGQAGYITEEPVLEQAATNTLQTASPNPFTHTTTISYTIAQPGPTKLWVSTILGKEVTSLVNTAAHEAGEYTVEFDGTNLPAGMYIYSLQSNGCQQSKRLVIVR